MLEIVHVMVSSLCAGGGSRDYHATSYAICKLNERKSSVLAALYILNVRTLQAEETKAKNTIKVCYITI